MIRAQSMKRLYQTVALGGTFDVFHKGHEQLLSTAFKLSQRVIIGITSDNFVTTLGKSHPVEPYSKRVRSVRRYLSRHAWSQRGEIHPLNDPFGPAAERKNLDALIVTLDTLSSGRRLNQTRRKRGLSRVKIQTVPCAMSKDGKPISSTRIRRGQIGRTGVSLHPPPRENAALSTVSKKRELESRL